MPRYTYHIILSSTLYLTAAIVLLFFSCSHRSDTKSEQTSDSTAEVYDMDNILESGELIAVTISGPESYYQYHGADMGPQYFLAEKFANSQGVRIRMEIARDTTELIDFLKHNKADLIAYELPQSLIKRYGLLACGLHTDSLRTSWAVRRTSPVLSRELNKWYKPSLLVNADKEMKSLVSRPLVMRHARVQFYSKQKGVISPYDGLFVRYGQTVSWDWRLLAAQCWQESGFDPRAVSWAGARGLMQIMPSTGEMYGVSTEQLYEPEINIATSVRFIKRLSNQFADIPHPIERQRFVLAAYNGGYYHIRDAMSLARKYGRNPHSWNDVSFFVYHLSEPQYYRDPVVKYGYMVGSETYGYVNQIMTRWNAYRGCISGTPMPSLDLAAEPVHAHKRNRFSRKNQIISSSDSMFQIK